MDELTCHSWVVKCRVAGPSSLSTVPALTLETWKTDSSQLSWHMTHQDFLLELLGAAVWPSLGRPGTACRIWPVAAQLRELTSFNTVWELQGKVEVFVVRVSLPWGTSSLFFFSSCVFRILKKLNFLDRVEAPWSHSFFYSWQLTTIWSLCVCILSSPFFKKYFHLIRRQHGVLFWKGTKYAVQGIL